MPVREHHQEAISAVLSKLNVRPLSAAPTTSSSLAFEQQADGRNLMTSQLSIFDAETACLANGLTTPRHLNHKVSGKPGLQNSTEVPGLVFCEGFLTPAEESLCIERIDAAEGLWLDDLSRRVQHYGWRYDYKARSITPDMHIGELPDWLSKLAQRLYDETSLFDRVPEQVIVNEYLPGQGIAMHTDHRGFGATVCTISLGDDWEMDFSEDWTEKRPALLFRRSCVLLTGESRSTWQHGIAPRKSELTANGRRDRRRRVSLTFRTVLNRDGAND